MSALLRAFLLALAAASGAAFISSSPPPLFATYAASAASTRTATSMGGFGKAAAAQKDKAPKFLGKKSIIKQMKSYIALQKAQEEGMVTRDVYVKAVLRDETVNEKFWFVGKVAHRAGFSTDQALGMQKRVVLEHAKLLQGELKLAKSLHMWHAPGNTELSVAQYQQTLTPLDAAAASSLEESAEAEAMRDGAVGFEPEQYQEEKDGFFVRLKEDGTPRDGKEGGLSPKFVSPQELEMMGESVQNPSNMATDLDGLVESLDKGKKFRKEATADPPPASRPIISPSLLLGYTFSFGRPTFPLYRDTTATFLLATASACSQPSASCPNAETAATTASIVQTQLPSLPPSSVRIAPL
eukprot:CAMPEP_0119526318 /NCGR_PEP_ID=MMETSP1344-20130328/40954_1 /TAXON_ID=236787 /ORGANISM="Florenciella parvula, Strain CCMP2471" /LENGTH=353 /DNA_ID=CAMNT_0007565285 /DNA_START=9 /DNA_END=1071 /DNA_ORIENTATION=+